MAEPLEINISKSFVEYGGKQWATYESGGGVTVQIWKGQQLEQQQNLSYADYALFREKAPEIGLRAYPDPALRPKGGTSANGNTLGRVVGQTAPTAVPAEQANPPVEAETEEEGITGEQVLDGIQLGLDVVGLIPVVGEVADIASAAISLVRGDYVGAGLSLLSAIPFVGYAGTAGKAARYGAKMAEASGKAGKGTPDLAGATKPSKNISQDQKYDAEPEWKKNKEGGNVKDNGRDCRLRAYSDGCPAGKTPHHVVPDRVFRMPGKGGVRLPNGIKHKNGYCICVEGASPRKKGLRPNEHGMIHALYDAEEQTLGLLGDPVGTAPLWKLEAAGVAAAAAITRCNPVVMAAELRAHHQSQGLLPSDIYRADPLGNHISKVTPATLGRTSTPTGGGGL